jgi:3-hydroxyacyl-CoA dehydrogenase
VWKHNIAEVMGRQGTDPAVFERVVQFAHRIGMVPLPLRKEHPGYLLNTMLMPMLIAALLLTCQRSTRRGWLQKETESARSEFSMESA